VVYFLIYETLELKIQLRKELSFDGVRFGSSESTSYHRNLLQPYILVVSKKKKNDNLKIFLSKINCLKNLSYIIWKI